MRSKIAAISSMLRFKIDPKHVITEILLVTVGILIAIQIDSWYNNRVEQKEINSYLVSIQDEFDSESYWLKEIKLVDLTKQKKYLNTMTRMLVNQEKDSIDWLVRYAQLLGSNYGVKFYDFPVLDEFIQLEYLNKIENDSLRLWLKEYSKLVGYSKVQWDFSVEQTANLIEPFLIKNFTYNDLYPNPDPKIQETPIPQNLRKSYKNLYDDPDFLNIIALKSKTINMDIEVLEDAMDSFKNILRQIKKYNKEKSNER